MPGLPGTEKAAVFDTRGSSGEENTKKAETAATPAANKPMTTMFSRTM